MSHKLTFDEIDKLNKTPLRKFSSVLYNQKEGYRQNIEMINSRSHAKKAETRLDTNI